MRIIRGTSIHAIELLKPLFLADELELEGDVEAYAEGLKNFLKTNPEHLFILIALQEPADELIVEGFIIAWNPPGYSYVNLSQAWTATHADKRLADLLLLRLVQWASQNNKTQIRIETPRDELAISRRWGFKVVSRTMALDIQQDFEMRILELLSHSQLIQEVKDGKRTENHEQPERATESVGPAALPASSEEPGQTSPELQRSASGGSDSGVIEVTEADIESARQRIRQPYLRGLKPTAELDAAASEPASDE